MYEDIKPTKHKIRMQTLTPVHTGSGKELTLNNDFVFDEKQKAIVILDFDKLAQTIEPKHISNWVAWIDDTANNKVSFATFLRGLNITNLADVALRTIPLSEELGKVFNSQTIKGHNQTCGKALLAGSSIKGAVRTAFLTSLIEKDLKDNEEKAFVFKKEHLANQRGIYADSQVQGHYLTQNTKKLDPNKDLFRFLRISDVEFDKTILYKNVIVNLFKDSWGIKSGQSSYTECIAAGQYAEGTIQIPKALKNMVEKAKYITNHVDKLELYGLFDIINQHTLNLLQDEIDFWEGEDASKAIGSYLEDLYDIEEAAKSCEAGECVLRVGAGGGWIGMTGGWMERKVLKARFTELKGYLRKKHPSSLLFPKTRKLSQAGQCFGFLKMKVMQ